MPNAGMWRRGFTFTSRVASGAIMLLAACSDGGMEPTVSAEGSYTLTSYDSHTLPVVLRVMVENPTTPGSESVRCEDRLAAMALTLNPDGSFTTISERRLVCDNGDPDAVPHPSASGSYEAAGMEATLTFDDVDGFVTVATGMLNANGLTITKRVTTGPNGTVTDPARMEFGRIVAL